MVVQRRAPRATPHPAPPAARRALSAAACVLSTHPRIHSGDESRGGGQGASPGFAAGPAWSRPPAQPAHSSAESALRAWGQPAWGKPAAWDDPARGHNATQTPAPPRPALTKAPACRDRDRNRALPSRVARCRRLQAAVSLPLGPLYSARVTSSCRGPSAAEEPLVASEWGLAPPGDDAGRGGAGQGSPYDRAGNLKTRRPYVAP